MIPITRENEPQNFDETVRRPGKDWLASKGLPLVGPLPKKIQLADYWTRCTPELRRLYGGMCAYMSVYIPEVVGDASVEHFKPKSLYAEHAYEWNNYRFVCGMLNSCK